MVFDVINSGSTVNFQSATFAMKSSKPVAQSIVMVQEEEFVVDTDDDDL